MPEDPRPNIVFILTDDLGWADLSSYGSGFYETPHLDRLRERGVAFTDAYAACPVCSPTRASVLTGQYPARVNLTNWIPGNPWGKLMGVPYFEQLPGHHRTVASELREGGYQTWHVGKWHVGDQLGPRDFGFDVNVAGNGWGMPRNGYFSPWGIDGLADGPEGAYLTDRLTDEAIGLIRGRGDRPFFLHLCHYAVHTPVEAPAPLTEKYRRKAAAMGLDRLPEFEEGERMPALHLLDRRVTRRLRQSDPAYAAMVENLDANVGRLLAALEQEGIAGDTLVVFTSDNGGLATAEGSPTCNAPLSEGKGWCAEGGLRVPLIAAWPGRIPAGGTSRAPVTSPDLFPTFLEAAGLPGRPDLHRDGLSLLDAMRGGDGPERGGIFWHYPHYSNQGGTPACAVRSGRFKLIEWFEDGRVALFDLEADPGERRDLAATEPGTAASLHALLRGWRRSIEAQIPEPNPLYEQMLAGAAPRPDALGRIPGDDT